MQSYIDYNSLRSVSSSTSDLHAMSLQDTLEAGTATPTSTKALDDHVSKVYRPVIGFYRNTYITDDHGNSIQVSAKHFAKICHAISLNPPSKEDKQCLS